jgi:hypothetical protein
MRELLRNWFVAGCETRNDQFTVCACGTLTAGGTGRR